MSGGHRGSGKQPGDLNSPPKSIVDTVTSQDEPKAHENNAPGPAETVRRTAVRPGGLPCPPESRNADPATWSTGVAPTKPRGALKRPQYVTRYVTRIYTAPPGTRTPGPLIKSQRPETHNPLNSKDLEQDTERVCTPVCTGAAEKDPELAAVVAAWADLSEHVRQAIVTLVEAAIQSEEAGVDPRSRDGRARFPRWSDQTDRNHGATGHFRLNQEASCRKVMNASPANGRPRGARQRAQDRVKERLS